MLNYFNNNILPVSEELQRLLDDKELREDKDRQDAEIIAEEARRAKELEEVNDCE